MKTHSKLMWLLMAPLALFLFACSSDNDDNPTDPEKPGTGGDKVETVIKSIKFMNAGADGAEVLEGTVNEDQKLITFPAIDPETKLSAVKFEAVLSEGAKLDQETYDFTMKEGETEIEKTIKVLNGKKTGEYFVKLELKLDVVQGGDFDKAVVYNHSASGTIYPYYTGQLTRCADFDGNYALIISRVDGLSPHLLKLDDIVAGNVASPIMLNTEGIEGGTFSVSAGRLVQDRVYIANMAGGTEEGHVKVYMWTNPEAKPEIIFDGEMESAGTGRYGDSMDMDLDNSGNGYIFFENNATGEIDRLQIKNFTEVEKQDIIAPVDKTEYKGGQYFSYSKVQGTPYFLYTGYEAPLMLVDAEGNTEAMVSLQENTKVPTAINHARVVEFNNSRYLVAVTACRNESYLPQTMIIYDISKGKDIVEAIENLNETATEPKIVYEFVFGKDNTNSPGTNAAAVVKGDKLYTFGSADNNGFIVVEIPEKVAE